MPHLLVDDPEDDRFLDLDFLTEAVARFEEDDTVRDALVGAVEDLSRGLAVMNMNNDYKPYIFVRSRSTRVLINIADRSIGITKPCSISRNSQRFRSVAKIHSIVYLSRFTGVRHTTRSLLCHFTFTSRGHY